MADVDEAIEKIRNQASGRFDGCLSMNMERAMADEIQSLRSQLAEARTALEALSNFHVAAIALKNIRSNDQ